MANPLIAGAVRNAPVVIAGAVAAPAAIGVMVAATGCLCALMLVRHATQSKVRVAARKGEGFAFELGKETS